MDTKFTWAVRWNVNELPDENLCAMDDWALASDMFEGGDLTNVYFDSRERCEEWLIEYIDRVKYGNQEYSEIPLVAEYQIFELVKVIQGVRR